MSHNEFGQPIGEPLNWSPRERPGDVELPGRFCSIVPLNTATHAHALFAAYSEPRDWTYMSSGPFADVAAYRAWVEGSTDPKHYAVTVGGRPVGTLALMRIDAAHGVIEVGCVMFSPLMKQSPVSTEAQFLLMNYVFETLKYRRYEWKCDALNAPSRRAAARLGFTFEGIFRNATIYKGRSRDTAWFSMIDTEWPAVKRAFTHWLSPENFDSNGRQLKPLTAAAAGTPPSP